MPDQKPDRELTKRQQEVYDIIEDKIVNRGYSPTIREIGAVTGIRSSNGVMCHVLALQTKGFITRDRNKSRSIVLTNVPPKKVTLQQLKDSWRAATTTQRAAFLKWIKTEGAKKK